MARNYKRPTRAEVRAEYQKFMVEREVIEAAEREARKVVRDWWIQERKKEEELILKGELFRELLF